MNFQTRLNQENANAKTKQEKTNLGDQKEMERDHPPKKRQRLTGGSSNNE